MPLTYRAEVGLSTHHDGDSQAEPFRWMGGLRDYRNHPFHRDRGWLRGGDTPKNHCRVDSDNANRRFRGSQANQEKRQVASW